MADIRKVKCVLNGGLEKEVVADKSKGKRRLKRERKSEQASSCSYKQPKDSQHVIPEECTSEIYEKTENLPFDGEEIYTSLLKSMHAIVPVDNQYKAFLMQDYNMCKKMLKDQYVVIQRRVLIIEGIHRWMYCCSCNVAQERLLLSIPDNLTGNIEKDLEEKCIHVAPAKGIIEGFQMEISPEAAYVKGKQTENETDHTYDKQRANVHGRQLINLNLLIFNHMVVI
ncbi:uncharacterized protein LOC134682954 isoform X2 [Mytilus trossulus]|uniref:uncharacterized protein LOC134682954 isoform X2 n=1 Tax=Mytilus trossulus TaxID=6551 RepID=UPI003004496B